MKQSSSYLRAIAAERSAKKRRILELAFSMLQEREFAGYAKRCEQEGRRPFMRINHRCEHPTARFLLLESTPDDLRALAKALELPEDHPGPGVILRAYAAALEKTDKQFRWRDLNALPEAERIYPYCLAAQARLIKSPPTIEQWRGEFVRLCGKKSLPSDQSFRKAQKAWKLPLAKSKPGPKKLDNRNI